MSTSCVKRASPYLIPASDPVTKYGRPRDEHTSATRTINRSAGCTVGPPANFSIDRVAGPIGMLLRHRRSHIVLGEAHGLESPLQPTLGRHPTLHLRCRVVDHLNPANVVAALHLENDTLTPWSSSSGSTSSRSPA